MNLAMLAQLAVVVGGLMATGGMSNNKGKIEGTKWVNIKSMINNEQTIPAGIITLDFKKDGGFVQTILVQRYSGTYLLQTGDHITLKLDEPLDGHTELHAKFIIDRAVLLMRDSDGTTITFAKSK
ncbi:hypothetical protein [Zavarzinella formosa]|uniref:hypothetical protein n=1 Tax=Zavarzinella formosa TaxID=360055 RepID=UPI0002D857BC|nr:hypothetical protein [Zavarzinella formosa]